MDNNTNQNNNISNNTNNIQFYIEMPSFIEHVYNKLLNISN